MGGGAEGRLVLSPFRPSASTPLRRYALLNSELRLSTRTRLRHRHCPLLILVVAEELDFHNRARSLVGDPPVHAATGVGEFHVLRAVGSAANFDAFGADGCAGDAFLG